MKVNVIVDVNTEEEICVRCKEITPEITKMIEFLENKSRKIECVTSENQKVYIRPMDVLYIESIDGTTFLYTNEEVYKARITLQELEESYTSSDYFRGAKNLIINIQHIRSLQSQFNGRIIVTMNNDECLVVSRHYAGYLKEILKGDKR